MSNSKIHRWLALANVSFRTLGRIYKYAALGYLVIYWIWIFVAIFFIGPHRQADLRWAIAMFIAFFVEGSFWYWLIGSAWILFYRKVLSPNKPTEEPPV